MAKLTVGTKWVGSVGLKLTWVVVPSTIILGIPYMMVLDGPAICN